MNQFLYLISCSGIRWPLASSCSVVRLPARPKLDDDGAGDRQQEDHPLVAEPARLRDPENQPGQQAGPQF